MAGFQDLLLSVAPSKNPAGHFNSMAPLVSLLLLLSLHFLITASDIAFYGVNFNQSVILTDLGYGSGATTYLKLYNLAIGNIIVSAAVGTPSKQVHL
jgi:hypothetical protein